MLKRLLLVIVVAATFGAAILLSRPEPRVEDASISVPALPPSSRGVRKTVYGGVPRQSGACLICGADGTLGLSTGQ